jgi:hypothetical protein
VIRTDAPNLSLLECPQQLYLKLTGGLGNLIEEYRPALGFLPQTLAIRHRAGKGSTNVAEQFRLDQIGWNSAAVNGHERPCSPRAAQMDGASDQLLAGT